MSDVADRDDAYSVLDSQIVLAGRVITVRVDEVRMSDGSVARREVVGHPGAVAIVALDERDDVVLVNQFRHPVRARLDELPAGLLDVPDEPALVAAQRELAEEAGLRARDWAVLVDLFTSPGMTDEAIRIYLARGLSAIPDSERFVPEAEELTLTARRVPLGEAIDQALSGALTNAAAVAGILAAGVERARGWSGLRPAQAPWPGRADHGGR